MSCIRELVYQADERELGVPSFRKLEVVGGDLRGETSLQGERVRGIYMISTVSASTFDKALGLISPGYRQLG